MSYEKGHRYKAEYVELTKEEQDAIQGELDKLETLEKVRAAYEMCMEEAYYRKHRGDDAPWNKLDMWRYQYTRMQKRLLREYEVFGCLC